MFNLDNFYKSDKWNKFRNIIIDERTDNNTGYCCCEKCKKPIINKYDLIIHHKEELTEKNVNDYNVSLNPNNVEIVCFNCHNEIHDRFGHHKQVYLVYGAPCSGKTTWVYSVANKNDILLDMDNIWQMISINERYIKPDQLKENVFLIRDCILEMIKYRTGHWHNAYIIGGYPFAYDRERMINLYNAKPIFIDETIEVCLQRAKESGRRDWEKHIRDWFESYS